MAEKNLPAQVKKSTASDNRVRMGTQNADGTVSFQGSRINVGYTGGAGNGQPVAVVRQDKTWVNLGFTSSGPTWQAGVATISPSAATSAVVDVAFSVPFENSLVTVVTNLNSGAGATAGWGTRAINITATGFQVFAFGTSSTFTATVQWQAMRRTQ